MSKNRQHARKDVIPAVRIFTQSLQGINKIQSENRKRESDETIKLDKESVVETGNMYRQHQQQSHSLSIKGVVCNDLPPRFQKLYWPTDRSSRTVSDESSRQMHSSRKKSNDIFYKSASGKRRNQNNGSVVSRKNWNGTYQWKSRESDQVVKDAKTDSGYCDREDWDSELMDVSNAGVVPMFPNVSREGSDLLDQSWNSICNEQSDGKSSVKMDQIQPCKYSSLGNGTEHDGDKLYWLGFMRKPDNTRHNPGSRFQKRFTEQNNSSCTNRNNPKLETVADVARVHEDWDAEITTIPESDWSLNFFENLCTDTPRQSYQVSSQGHSSKEICSIGHELNKELTSSDLYLRGESNDAPCMRSVSSTTEQEFSDAIKSNGMYKDKKIQKSSVVFEGVSNKKSDFKIGVTSKEGNESHGEIDQTCLNFNEIDMSAKMSACKIFDIVENVLNEDKNSPAIMSAYREHENCPFGGKTTNLICSNLQRTHSCCGSVLTGEKGEKSLFPKNLNKSINSQKCNVVNPDMLLPSTKLFENYFESCERSIGINESNMGHFVNGKLDIKNVEDNVGLKDSTNGEKKIRHSSAVYSDMASMREFFPLEASLEEFSNSCPNQQDSSHWETASEDVLTVFDNGFYETEHLPGEPKVDGCSKLFVPDSVQVQKCERAEGNHSRLQSVTEDLDEVMKTVCAMENEHLLLTNRLDQNPSSHMLNSTNEIRTISRENTNSKLTGSKKSIVKKTKMDKLNVCMSQSEHQTETCHQNVSVEKCIYDYNNSSFVQTTNMTSSSFSNTGISNTNSSDNETTGQFSGEINSRTVPGESIGKNSEEADEKNKPQSRQKMASNHEEECSNFEKIEDNRFNYVGGMSAFDNKFPALLSQRTSCMHTPYYLRGVAQDGVGSDFSNQPHQKQTNTGKICRESCLDSEKTDTKNAVYPLQNKNNLIVDKSTVAISDKKDTFPSGMYFQYLNAYENVMALNSMQERRGESDADWMHLISSDISMEQQAEEFYGSQQMKMKRQSNRLLGIGRGRGSVVHSFPKSEKENYGSNIDVKKTVCQPLAFTHHSTMLSGIDGHRKDGLDLTSENVPFKSRFPMHYSRDTKLETNRNNEIDLHLLTSDGIKKFACRSYEGKVHEKEKGFSSTNCNSVDGYEMETPKIIDCRKPDDALHYKKGQTHLDQFAERYVIPQRRGSEKYTDYVKDGSDVKEITCSVRKLGPMTAGGQSQAYENERLNFHDEARLVKEGKQNRYFSNASYGDSMQYSHSSRHNEPPFDNVATPLVPRANNDAELYISMESHINLKDDLDQIPKKIDCEAGKWQHNCVAPHELGLPSIGKCTGKDSGSSDNSTKTSVHACCDKCEKKAVEKLNNLGAYDTATCHCPLHGVQMWVWRTCSCPAGEQPTLCEVRTLSTTHQPLLADNSAMEQLPPRTVMCAGRSKRDPDNSVTRPQNKISFTNTCPSSDNFAMEQWPPRVVDGRNSKENCDYSVTPKQHPVSYINTWPSSDNSSVDQWQPRNVVDGRSKADLDYSTTHVQNPISFTNTHPSSDISAMEQQPPRMFVDAGRSDGDPDYSACSANRLISFTNTRPSSVIPLSPEYFINSNSSFQSCNEKEKKDAILLPPKDVMNSNTSFQFCTGKPKDESVNFVDFNKKQSAVTSTSNPLGRKIQDNYSAVTSERPSSCSRLTGETYIQPTKPHEHCFSRLQHEPQTVSTPSEFVQSKQRTRLLNSTNSFLPIVDQKQSCYLPNANLNPKLVGYSSSEDETTDKVSVEKNKEDKRNVPYFPISFDQINDSPTKIESFSLQTNNSAEKRKFSEMKTDNANSDLFDCPLEKDVRKSRGFQMPKCPQIYSWHSSMKKKPLFRSSSDSSLVRLPQPARVETANKETTSKQYEDKTELEIKKHEKENISSREITLQTNTKLPQETVIPMQNNIYQRDVNSDEPLLNKSSDNDDTDSFDANFSFASQESIEKPFFFNPAVPPPPSPYFNPETFWQCYNPSSSPLAAYSPSLLGGGVIPTSTLPYYDNYLGGNTTSTSKASFPLHTRISRSGYSLPANLVTDSDSPKLSETRSENSTPVSNWKARMKERANNHGVNFIDSHCHIDFIYRNQEFQGSFTKYMRLNSDTFPYTFEGCVSVFCRPESFTPEGGLWMDIAEETNIWLAFGCHPKNATSYSQKADVGLKKCLQHKKVVALGEIGLDYSGTFHRHCDVQKIVFRRQLDIALEMNLPLVIHCREAETDCLEILEEVVPKAHKIHCHCFTGTFDSAQKWLNLFPNLFIGLTPLVTRKSAWPTKNVAFHIPLDRLLLETDSPYFPPSEIPRGELKCSHPGFAFVVAEEVAYLKDLPVAQVLKACRENTRNMYGI